MINYIKDRINCLTFFREKEKGRLIPLVASEVLMYEYENYDLWVEYYKEEKYVSMQLYKNSDEIAKFGSYKINDHFEYMLDTINRITEG